MTGIICKSIQSAFAALFLALLLAVPALADGILDCVHFSDRFDMDVSPPLNTLCFDVCSESPCKLVSPQCGCKDGFGCYFEDGTRDCLNAGVEDEGVACSTGSDCSPGLSCLGIGVDEGEVVKRCIRACDSDSICTGGDGSLCAIPIFANIGDPEPTAEFCSLSCEPVTSNGCSTGSSCQIFLEADGKMRAFTHCRAPTGPGSAGSFCNDFSDCQAGLGCFDAGSGFQCLEYCTDNTDCSAFKSCVPFNPPVEIGETSYGVCVD